MKQEKNIMIMVKKNLYVIGKYLNGQQLTGKINDEDGNFSKNL